MGCKQKQHCCEERHHCCEKNHHEPLHCQCHRRKKQCHCKKEKHCKIERKLEKECMKIEWVVPQGATQSVFQTGGFNQLIGSGFIGYDKGDSPFIIVRFFLRGVQQGSEIQVFEDSSVAFTYTKFDRVTVSCPGSGVSENANCDHGCEGVLSIISRFPVFNY